MKKLKIWGQWILIKKGGPKKEAPEEFSFQGINTPASANANYGTIFMMPYEGRYVDDSDADLKVGTPIYYTGDPKPVMLTDGTQLLAIKESDIVAYEEVE